MKHFSDFLPPPRFLEMPAVGIDVEEDAVRFVELERKGGILKLKNYATRLLPPGTIKNGEILEEAELGALLKKLRGEYKFDFAHLSLPEEKAYIFRTSVPITDSSGIRDNIEFQFEENVPLSLQESVFDYSIIKRAHKDSSHLDVVVVVLPRQYVTHYTDLIAEAGISPLSLQIAPMAIARALFNSKNSGTYMVVNFYRDKTSVVIMSQGAVQFTSTVAIGSESFKNAIEKHFGVGREEALKIKREESYVSNKDKVELFFSLMGSVSALKDEMQRLFNYWHTFRGRSDDAREKIEQIILCGEDSVLPGLDEYLSIMLNVGVEVGNLWKNTFSFDEYIPQMKFKDSLNYAVSIGLAIGNGR